MPLLRCVFAVPIMAANRGGKTASRRAPDRRNVACEIIRPDRIRRAFVRRLWFHTYCFVNDINSVKRVVLTIVNWHFWCLALSQKCWHLDRALRNSPEKPGEIEKSIFTFRVYVQREFCVQRKVAAFMMSGPSSAMRIRTPAWKKIPSVTEATVFENFSQSYVIFMYASDHRYSGCHVFKITKAQRSVMCHWY